jgi:hypothetical protein
MQADRNLATGNWRTLAMTKLLITLLIGGILAFSGKANWLLWLTAGMTGLYIYNSLVLLQQAGGH